MVMAAAQRLATITPCSCPECAEIRDLRTALTAAQERERVLRGALTTKVNEWRVNAARETKSSMTGFPESQAADSARADIYESCADELAALAPKGESK